MQCRLIAIIAILAAMLRINGTLDSNELAKLPSLWLNYCFHAQWAALRSGPRTVYHDATQSVAKSDSITARTAGSGTGGLRRGLCHS
jgi:hypothetical protein